MNMYATDEIVDTEKECQRLLLVHKRAKYKEISAVC